MGSQPVLPRTDVLFPGQCVLLQRDGYGWYRVFRLCLQWLIHPATGELYWRSVAQHSVVD